MFIEREDHLCVYLLQYLKKYIYLSCISSFLCRIFPDIFPPGDKGGKKQHLAKMLCVKAPFLSSGQMEDLIGRGCSDLYVQSDKSRSCGVLQKERRQIFLFPEMQRKSAVNIFSSTLQEVFSSVNGSWWIQAQRLFYQLEEIICGPNGQDVSFLIGQREYFAYLCSQLMPSKPSEVGLDINAHQCVQGVVFKMSGSVNEWRNETRLLAQCWWNLHLLRL